MLRRLDAKIAALVLGPANPGWAKAAFRVWLAFNLFFALGAFVLTSVLQLKILHREVVYTSFTLLFTTGILFPAAFRVSGFRHGRFGLPASRFRAALNALVPGALLSTLAFNAHRLVVAEPLPVWFSASMFGFTPALLWLAASQSSPQQSGDHILKQPSNE